MSSAHDRRTSVEKPVTRKWNGKAFLPVDRTVREDDDLTLHLVVDMTLTGTDEIEIAAMIEVVVEVDHPAATGDGEMMTDGDHMVAIDVNQ